MNKIPKNAYPVHEKNADKQANVPENGEKTPEVPRSGGKKPYASMNKFAVTALIITTVVGTILSAIMLANFLGIMENGTNESKKEPEIVASWNVKDAFSVKSHAIFKNADGNPVLIINYTFKNITGKKTSVKENIQLSAKQGSATLPSGFSTNNDAYRISILPYNTVEGKIACVLRDTVTSVTLSVKGPAGDSASFDFPASAFVFSPDFADPPDDAASGDAASDLSSDTVPEPTPEPEPAPEPEPEPEPQTMFFEGQYKVGVDLPAGEYVLQSTGTGWGYFLVSADANGDDIVFNDNFETSSIITVYEGEYLKLTRCAATPIDYFYDHSSINLNSSGIMLIVGRDIPAGEYKLKTTSSSGWGYYCIYTSSRQDADETDNIVSNDNFENQSYVLVEDGQYLKLTGCVLVQ